MMERRYMSAFRPRRLGTSIATALFIIAAISGGLAAEEQAKKAKTEAQAAQDSTMKLRGGEEGTVFKSLKIEGEDRIRIKFERPELILSLEPGTAPGLEWKSIHAVLDRDMLDFFTPFLARSAGVRRQCFARPWLDHLSTNGVARFRPALEGVDRWRLLVANSKGETVASFEGKGKPPKEIVWDGRSLEGKPVPPGLVYSYVLEAYDRAGNKRNFVGDGFELPSYMVNLPEGLMMLFSGEELSRSQRGPYGAAAPPPEILLEVANYLNQEQGIDASVRIEVSARTFDDANRLAKEIIEQLTPILLGDVLRVQPVTNIQPDAPEQGTIAVVVTR
ncbi:MAG: hypothetical protein GTO29_08445 [Candidatus Latescibacteria bacterium]|nr:hypothetical protein [Candidatus Latescibacterota bacterium]NIO56192.1 hypothetical protein [Candidatus Latescibacterota bacterium]